jgi:acetylglutamate kinase
VRILIKLGGTLLDSPDSRDRLASEIGQAMSPDTHIVVVHGGGKQMTRFLNERGVESRFVNGLRVTTGEVLDAVLKVFAGSVNHELVAAFIARGVRAVGLTGMDAFLTEAEQLSPELGHVGKVVASDPALLHLLAGNRYLPVVACVGGDRGGHYYNVNADGMAVACAASFGATKLLFLTDVDGVRNGAGETCPSLTIADCEALIAAEVATGGMRAKLEAAMSALRQGVGEVVIAPGVRPGIVGDLIAGRPIGTVVGVQV